VVLLTSSTVEVLMSWNDIEGESDRNSDIYLLNCFTQILFRFKGKRVTHSKKFEAMHATPAGQTLCANGSP